MKLLVATTNAGKVRELAAALSDSGIEVTDLEAAGAADAPAPDEIGATFAENALLKAHYYHKLTGLLTVADDSGLEVQILGGRPGLYSARYGDTDAERIEKLLGELDGVPSSERTARFVCVLALVGDDVTGTFTGTCDGTIRHMSAGANGFGFDPIFIPNGSDRTFAEMTSDEKAALSHRGRAISQLVETLRTW